MSSIDPSINLVPNKMIPLESFHSNFSSDKAGSFSSHFDKASHLPESRKIILEPSSNISGGSSTWGHLVQEMVREVNEKQSAAGEKVRDVLSGGPTEVHDALIAVQESGVSFQMLAEIRNKFLESYQEIMRMQV